MDRYECSGWSPRNGDTDHWATSDLDDGRLDAAEVWGVHLADRGVSSGDQAVLRGRGCQARRAEAQRNHIGLSIRAFLRLECHCFALGMSWFQAKTDVIRDAVRTYLAHPNMRLPKAA